MTSTIYQIEIHYPGREPEAVLVKPAPAIKLVRRLMEYGIPHALTAMDKPLLSANQVEDMIDELERNKKEPA